MTTDRDLLARIAELEVARDSGQVCPSLEAGMADGVTDDLTYFNFRIDIIRRQMAGPVTG